MSLEAYDRRVCLLKEEVSEGTDSTPLPATDALQMLNGNSGVSANKIERPLDRPYFGHDPFVNSGFTGFIEGDIELVGAATAGSSAPIAVALLIAGFAETLDAGPPGSALYNVISSAFPSASAYFYHAGTLKKLLGARANLSQIMLNVDDYAKARIRIEGALANGEITEAALPTPTLTAFGDPTPITHDQSVMSINSFDVEGVGLTIDLGNTLQQTHHTEGLVYRIKDRKPTGTARFYRPAKASLDPWALWKAGTIVPISFVVTDLVTGMYVDVTARAQLEEPRETDINGDYGLEVPFRCIPSSAGNDELSVEFGEV